MQIGHYLFTCTLTEAAQLPGYKGSTFRGAFGHALKQTVCALRKQECSHCLLAGTCIYARVFELKPAAAKKPRLAAQPHPYVIRPPRTDARYFEDGSPFNFELLLFGEFNEALPYFIYAFERMGNIGIGKSKANFSLDKVTCGDRQIYCSGVSRLESSSALSRLEIDLPFSGESTDLILSLHTPLRVKTRGHLARELDFATLTRTTLRRLSGLLTAYGGGDPDLPYSELVREAERVKVTKNHSHWHDWQRYSNRQQESMQFGGMVGEIVYRQVPAAHRHLLELAARVHLGKQTSFGLGQIGIELC